MDSVHGASSHAAQYTAAASAAARRNRPETSNAASSAAERNIDDANCTCSVCGSTKQRASREPSRCDSTSTLRQGRQWWADT